MPFIIVEPCVGTCDTACVDVCPVDCIHGPYDKEGRGEEAKADGFIPKDTDSLYIDPEECIDCAACEPECPVEAIYEESEVPGEWNELKKNARSPTSSILLTCSTPSIITLSLLILNLPLSKVSCTTETA